MFCDNCKIKNASIFYNQNINGENKQYNLCYECSKKINEDVIFFDIFKDFFFNFNNFEFSGENLRFKCEKCGNTLEDIKNTGKMGCENCYILFKENILPIIKNIQYDNKHIGKSFDIIDKNNKKENFEKDTYKNNLKQDLKKAIEIEDYELAIILRDKIREIEKGANL